MKKLSLGFLSLLAITLLIYACSKDEAVTTQQEESRFELVSPNDLVLADSDAELKSMMAAVLLENHNYRDAFTVKNVTYTVLDDITYADIRFTLPAGNQKNMIFYWLMSTENVDGASQRDPLLINIDPLPAPTCTGLCFVGEDCVAVYDLNIKSFVCECGNQNDNNCTLTVGGDGGTSITCTGNCDDGAACEAAYKPATNQIYCRCDDGSHSNCTPVITEQELPFGD